MTVKIENQKLSRLGSEKFIYLTTKGRKTGILHRVELWFATQEDKVYLSHEGNETDWMKNMKKNPEINFQIEKESFTGRARFLQTKSSESAAGKTALYEKYYGTADKKVIDDWFSLSTLVEIVII